MEPSTEEDAPPSGFSVEKLVVGVSLAFLQVVAIYSCHFLSGIPISMRRHGFSTVVALAASLLTLAVTVPVVYVMNYLLCCGLVSGKAKKSYATAFSALPILVAGLALLAGMLVPLDLGVMD